MTILKYKDENGDWQTFSNTTIGNADTLDGRTASENPTAGQIPIVNSDGRLNLAEDYEDLSSLITFNSGWGSGANYSFERYGKMVIFQGYIPKSSDITNNDIITYIPEAYRPRATATGASMYGVAHGASTDKVARVRAQRDTGGVYITNPSASMTIAVFSLTWFIE